MTPQTAQHEIRRLVQSFSGEEDPDFEGFLKLNEHIEQLLPTLTRTEAQALWDGLEKLGNIMKARHQDIAKEIEGMGTRRRAMRGYGHLRSHQQGQRVVKNV